MKKTMEKRLALRWQNREQDRLERMRAKKEYREKEKYFDEVEDGKDNKTDK